MFLLGNRLSSLFLQQEGDLLTATTYSLDNIFNTDIPFRLDLSEQSLITSFSFSFGALLLYLCKSFNSKKMRKGIEHGSSRWATMGELKELTDKNPLNNIVLSQKLHISINTKLQSRNNNHVLVIGGAGTGKTWRFLKPNLMQMYGSYVVTDPKGEILRSCGKMLEDNGYRVVVLNLDNMKQSHHYNPFEYIREEADEDIMILIQTIMDNTNGDKKGGGDPFWEKAEMLFLQAIFYYLAKEAPKSEQTLFMVMELIRLGHIVEDDPDFVSPLDLLFEELSENHIAKLQYKGFKQAAGKTAQSIIISAYARLAPFNINTIQEFTSTDDLQLDSIGEQKTALFVIISPTDQTFNFIAAMMYTQLFAQLNYSANWKHNGRLPIPVEFLLDEFANIGKIPNFEKILAYARSLNIGIVPIFQSLSQLKEMYKDSWGSIIDNCESFLFLGGKVNETLKYVSEMLGKETIDAQNRSRSYGKDKSNSLQDQILGRDLLTPDEVGKLGKKNQCIVAITGYDPFLDNKYDPTKHPNYKQLADYSDENAYVFNPTPKDDFELEGDVLEMDIENFELESEVEEIIIEV